MAPKSSKATRASGETLDCSVQAQMIQLDRLSYDPTNPRIAERLGPSPSQKMIEDMLLGGDMKARELIPSFIENGYIPYEPMVVRANDRNDGFIVIEGNRRLAALRSMLLSEDEEERKAFSSHNLDRVPCLVFRGNDRQLTAYLGLRHLSKTKDWSTNAKALFVERTLKSGFSLQEAGRLTNTTSANLRLILLTRRMFDEASVLGLALPTADAEGETIFWHLGDAVRRLRTKEYLQLQENSDPLGRPVYDQTRFENLVSWLYGNSKQGSTRVISNVRDIKALDLCLGNERATKALEEGASLAEAMEELEAAGATAVGHLDRAKRSAQRAMSFLSDVDRSGLGQVEQAVKSLRDALEQLEAAVTHRVKILSRK